MSNETTYSVKLRYVVDGKTAARETSGLIQSAKQLEQTTHGVTSALSGMVAVAAGAFGVEKLTKAFIGFNASAQDARISLSAMIEGSFGGSWDAASAKANTMYAEFQKFSTTTPVTTAEIMDFGRGVFMASSQAGASIKETTNIAEQGVIAAKSFGADTKDAAFAISEMLQGNARKTNSTVQVFMGLMKTNTEEFNRLDPSKRLAGVQGVLNSSAMKDAAAAFGSSWSGVLSTFEDKLQILGGQIGLPLFKALTKEIASWSDWLGKNTEKIDEFARRFASGLVEGFEIVKSVVSFLVDHADTLILVAKTWAAVKIGGMVGGLMGQGVNGAAGMLGSIAGASAPISGAAGVAGALPAAGQALAAGYAIGSIINEETGASDKIADSMARLSGRIDATTDRFEQLQKQSGLLDKAMASRRGENVGGFSGTTFNANLLGKIDKERADVNAAEDYIRAQKAMTIFDKDSVRAAKTAKDAFDARGVTMAEAGSEKGDLSRITKMQTEIMSSALDRYGTGITRLNETQLKALDVQKAQEEIMQYMASSNDARNAFAGVAGGSKFMSAMDQAVVDSILGANSGSGKNGMKKPGDINVHIERIEVQSDDPDRMGFGLVQFFRDAVKNPSAAAAALREG